MTSHTIVCSSCGTANRIPADKEGKAGRCGSCHARLAPLYTRPQPLNENNFDPFVNSYSGPVLAVFWAPWCPHCRAFLPTVQTMAERLAGKVAVVQINTQDNPQLARRFGVSGIPVTMLLRGGRVVAQLSGAQPAENVIAWFQRQQ